MPLGTDKQYDENWIEQDKIRRRIELKLRLKEEGVRKRYDPFLQIKKVIFTDPATDRYADLRKKGRMPGTPMKPSLYFGMLGVLFIPIILLHRAVEWERQPYLKKRAEGDIPYSQISGKATL